MSPGGGDDDLPIIVKHSIREVERLGARRRKDDEAIEKLCMELYKLERAVKRKNGGAGTSRAARHPRGPAPTVQGFQLRAAGNKHVVVTFDNAKQVKLPGTLKELFAMLAADTVASPDELVGFKSFDELSASLEKRLGRNFDRHATSQLIYRLRKSLEAMAEGRGLIESVPNRGARLRIRRKGSPAVCGA